MEKPNLSTAFHQSLIRLSNEKLKISRRRVNKLGKQATRMTTEQMSYNMRSLSNQQLYHLIPLTEALYEANKSHIQNIIAYFAFVAALFAIANEDDVTSSIYIAWMSTIMLVYICFSLIRDLFNKRLNPRLIYLNRCLVQEYNRRNK